MLFSGNLVDGDSALPHGFFFLCAVTFKLLISGVQVGTNYGIS